MRDWKFWLAMIALAIFVVLAVDALWKLKVSMWDWRINHSPINYNVIVK